MNAKREEYANCFVFTKAPINASKPPATIRINGILRHLDRSSDAPAGEAIVAAGVIGYFFNDARLSIGTSSIVPNRLSCKARTYATIAHRSSTEMLAPYGPMIKLTLP